MAITPKFKNLFSILFPPQCVCCHQQICRDDGNGLVNHQIDNNQVTDAAMLSDMIGLQWCADCLSQFPDFHDVGCPTCGAFINRPAALLDRCAVCFDAKLRFQKCVALGNYEGLLKQLVVSLKGNYDEPLAFQLGRLLGLQLQRHDFLADVDFLLPVPTHWKRRLKRGFHGACVIAEGVESVTRIPVRNNVMSCRRLTKKQGMLSTPQRIANVKGSFRLNNGATVDGATVLVIDDVMTSGATLSEIGKVLTQSKADSVYVGVVARGTRSR